MRVMYVDPMIKSKVVLEINQMWWEDEVTLDSESFTNVVVANVKINEDGINSVYFPNIDVGLSDNLLHNVMEKGYLDMSAYSAIEEYRESPDGNVDAKVMSYSGNDKMEKKGEEILEG